MPVADDDDATRLRDKDDDSCTALVTPRSLLLARHDRAPTGMFILFYHFV